jgi:hypothetical protein
MFSKLIPRKSDDLQVQATDNPRWQAPILLYPNPETGETKMNFVEMLR